MKFLMLLAVVAMLSVGTLAAPNPEDACNAELGKCKEYCKLGGKDDATCTDICTQDNSICLCSTKCQATDSSCIEKCYRAVEKYCENNLPVCTGFCMSVEKKEESVCAGECNKSKGICTCQRDCQNEECKKTCLPPPPPSA